MIDAPKNKINNKYIILFVLFRFVPFQFLSVNLKGKECTLNYEEEKS